MGPEQFLCNCRNRQRLFSQSLSMGYFHLSIVQVQVQQKVILVICFVQNHNSSLYVLPLCFGTLVSTCLDGPFFALLSIMSPIPFINAYFIPYNTFPELLSLLICPNKWLHVVFIMSEFSQRLSGAIVS